MARLLIILTLITVVALPFILRPKRATTAKTDDVLVVITPHNEAIRYEFARGFARWYRERTGRTVGIDWRIVGGTSEIARFLEGEYTTGFENYWTRRLNRRWSAEIQAGFQNARLPPDAPAIVREARAAFLASEVSCGIDVFFGGGTYDFDRQAAAGRLVDSGILRLRPEWFSDEVIPRRFGGEDYWHPGGLWVGAVLSSYGILYNRDSLARLGVEQEPDQWDDLGDPRLVGEVALTDPTKSGSVAKAFENMIQQQMQRRLVALEQADPAGEPKTREERAVREGWLDGMRLIQRIGANARYFTDTSQKPPIDVAAGNCAAGLCIDFYGRQQQEAVRRRTRGASEGESKDEPAGTRAPTRPLSPSLPHQRASLPGERLGYVSPAGGSVASVDPVGLLRGARNRDVGVAFVEYTLTMEGQKLWNFIPGTPGGPERFALRRLPVRRDFYRHEWKPLMADPDETPYEQTETLTYREEWTGRLFREMAFVIRVMCQDTHGELKRAWRAIHAAPEPAKSRALEVLQDVSAVEYDQVRGVIRTRLGSRDKVEEVRLAKELGQLFRRNYRQAEEIARGGK
jgi:iron(III) transport system substrate-binding protein